MIYQLKITLKKVSKPPVWRRVLVPDYITFDQLHFVIQYAMGWGNMHLYQFGYKVYEGISISVPTDSMWDKCDYDAATTKIVDFLNEENKKMVYTYDFGDDWIHDVVLEKTLNEEDVDKRLPICISAKGECPPEDCGGPWGYEDLKRICSLPNLEDWQLERLMLMGIDPNYCDFSFVDLDLINERLQQIKFVKPREKKVDKKKLDVRVRLLKSLTSDFFKKNGCSEKIIFACDDLINSVAESAYNLTYGRPEIWAAAFVQVTVEGCPFMMDGREISREEIYEHFGVKQAGVLNRVTQINDVKWAVTNDFLKDPVNNTLYEAIGGRLLELVAQGYSAEDAFKKVVEEFGSIME